MFGGVKNNAPSVKYEVDQSCFELVLQPAAEGTFHWQKEARIQLNSSKFWKQTSHRLLKS